MTSKSAMGTPAKGGSAIALLRTSGELLSRNEAFDARAASGACRSILTLASDADADYLSRVLRSHHRVQAVVSITIETRHGRALDLALHPAGHGWIAMVKTEESSEHLEVLPTLAAQPQTHCALKPSDVDVASDGTSDT